MCLRGEKEGEVGRGEEEGRGEVHVGAMDVRL